MSAPCRIRRFGATYERQPDVRVKVGDLVTWGREGKQGQVVAVRDGQARIFYEPPGVRPTYVVIDVRRVRKVKP